MTIAAEPQPLHVLRPRRGWQALDLGEIWRYRDVLVSLAQRDVKLRYRQTALGVIWVVLQPLAAAAIFAFVFGRVAKLPAAGGVSYFVFAYAGLLAWNVFNSTLAKASTSLLQDSRLISKVYFPRIVLPLSTVLSSLIDFAVGLAFFVAVMLVQRITPSVGMLMLPLWLLVMLMLAVGLGLYAAALMVSYRDVQYTIPFLVQILLYASPVAYAVASVPQSLRLLYYLNPLSGLLEGFRWSLVGHTTLAWGPAVYACSVAVVVLLTGAFTFKKMERTFADVI